MNRKERRANKNRDGRDGLARAPAAAAGVQDMVVQAAIHQRDGRHREAVGILREAIAREPGHAGAHDAIAMAYQALGRGDAAVRHFREAISLGLLGVEALIKQSPAVMAALGRLAFAFPRPLPIAELIGAGGAGSLAEDALLLALLQSRAVCDLELERLLTAIRRALLREVAGTAGRWFALACALAQQCFINEYVFVLDDSERAQTRRLLDGIVQAISAGSDIAPSALAVAACYEPLHRLPGAAKLAERSWPTSIEALLTRQLHEPLAELADRAAIPAPTEIEDAVSRAVRDQYEENPYPRWTVALPVQATTLEDFLREQFGVVSAGLVGREILIAGCGTGEHSIETARRFPQAKLLAIDINRSGLAYARRKTREMRLVNIEYAVADILRLGSIDRRFDLIEAGGVLHHMADPEAGWRVLLSLLRPGGVMRIGLYSALGRRQLDAGRALIAERGYLPTADDIRVWRQELIRRNRPIGSSDFFTTSGCRDLCFNVMEHRFTLPRIQAFLEANRLTLLALEAPAEVREQFNRSNPEPAASTDLRRWNEFEQSHPQSFQAMYFLWARCDTAAKK
jgi:SAM-dependent methyltransferase